MNLLRAVLHMVIAVVTVVPWAVAALLASPFLSHDALYRFCTDWGRLFVRSGEAILGIRNRVHGLDNLPQAPNARVVLLVKHQSTWETFLLVQVIRRPLAYVLKRSLLYIPFFGWCLARLRMIYIDRDQTLRAVSRIVQQGQQALDAGSWVVMFPEGTRVPRGQKGNYHASGALLAIQCNAVIVPVAVTSARCWPRKAFVKRPGVVDISFGPPIASQGRKARAVMAEVEQWIEAEMRRLDPDAYVAGASVLGAAP